MAQFVAQLLDLLLLLSQGSLLRRYGILQRLHVGRRELVLPPSAFLGFGAVLVCATSPVARNRIAHTFHADFILLSFLVFDDDRDCPQLIATSYLTCLIASFTLAATLSGNGA